MSSLGRLILFALTLRVMLPAAALAVTGTPGTFETSDSAEYLSLAGSLLESGGFSGAGGPEL